MVELWLTDWCEPDLRVLIAKGTLGEVKRDGNAFTAELRGLSDRLSQEKRAAVHHDLLGRSRR